MTLHAIGFDLDNTLFDQAQHMRSFFVEAAQHVAVRHGVSSEAAHQALLNVWLVRTSYYPHLFDEALAELGLTDAHTVKALVALYHEHRAELSLFEGVEAMLRRLRERCELFLITDGNERMQRGKIESLQLTDRFDHVVITGAFGKAWSKPALHAYNLVIEHLGGDARNYVYVGDNPACDFLGANELGMTTVRVMTSPFSTHAPPSPAHEARHIVQRTIDLERLVDEL